MKEQSIHPVTISERIQLLDVFRGLAIFGILMVNMQVFYHPISYMMIGSQSGGETLAVITESFIKFFFEGKFYVLFSMLFGYGFWLFINKQAAEGVRIIPVFRRRLFVLLLFGISHFVFLWGGDILFFYALFGFFLILSRNISDERLISWAIPLALVPSLFTLFFWGISVVFSGIPEAAQAMETGMAENAAALKSLAEEAFVVHSTGNYLEILSMRLREWMTLTQGGILVFYPVVLGMFLFGAWIARKRYVKNYQDHLPLIRKVFWWSLSLGIILNALYAISYQYSQPGILNLWAFLGTITHTSGGVSFALLYTSGIILLTAKGSLKNFNEALAPVGRMALTNYLLHSIICTTLFYAYGFGLMGKVEIWQGILLTFGIFALQIPFSKWWLSHFKYGPFEWLWRTLTYLKIQPFRY
jgi:uncharacterized protein